MLRIFPRWHQSLKPTANTGGGTASASASASGFLSTPLPLVPGGPGFLEQAASCVNRLWPLMSWLGSLELPASRVFYGTFQIRPLFPNFRWTNEFEVIGI